MAKQRNRTLISDIDDIFYEDDNDNNSYYDDSDDYEDDTNQGDINIDELYDEIYSQLTEEFQGMLNDYMIEYTKKIKSYINETIQQNNSKIEEYINDMLNEVTSEDYNSEDEEFNEEEQEEVVIDENIKNKFSKMVTHKKTGSNTQLQETMNSLFNSNDINEDSNFGETFTATSADANGFGQAVKGKLGQTQQNVNLRSFLPPDEGRGNEPELGTYHRDSILDVKGAIPDDSITKALTRDYSKMFTKKK